MNRTFRFIIKPSSAVVEASVRGFKYIARGDKIFSSLENEGYLKVKQGVRSQLKDPTTSLANFYIIKFLNYMGVGLHSKLVIGGERNTGVCLSLISVHRTRVHSTQTITMLHRGTTHSNIIKHSTIIK